MRGSVKKLPPIHLTDEKLRDILKSVGVKIIAETETDLLCLCCFHHNVDTPAFNIEKRSPYRFKCWNGKCNQKGNIFSLLTKKGYTYDEAKKMLLKGVVEIDDLEALIRELIGEEQEEENVWEEVDAEKFTREDEQHGGIAKAYTRSRGISEEAYRAFGMGYSSKRKMLVVPAFDEHRKFIGVIGRSLEGKEYRYSSGLQRGSTIWNINNASAYDSIILTEGSLDSVYIWQAGFKNVGAVLGSSISPAQWKLIRKYFQEIICFFDNDEPGQNLTESIVKNIKGIGVSVVAYPRRTVITSDGSERSPKDPGELTAPEIQEMLLNRKSSIELLLKENYG